jgi:hypothetical protein
MSLTNAAESSILALLFTETTWTGIATPVTNSWWISLHTGSPGEAASAQTAGPEANYTSYARVEVPRDGTNWTVSGTTQVANNLAITFPEATGGSNTITHFGIGTDSAGAGNLIFYGSLSQNLAVSVGIQPEFAASALTVTAD